MSHMAIFLVEFYHEFKVYIIRFTMLSTKRYCCKKTCRVHLNCKRIREIHDWLKWNDFFFFFLGFLALLEWKSVIVGINVYCVLKKCITIYNQFRMKQVFDHLMYSTVLCYGYGRQGSFQLRIGPPKPGKICPRGGKTPLCRMCSGGGGLGFIY